METSPLKLDSFKLESSTKKPTRDLISSCLKSKEKDHKKNEDQSLKHDSSFRSMKSINHMHLVQLSKAEAAVIIQKNFRMYQQMKDYRLKLKKNSKLLLRSTYGAKILTVMYNNQGILQFEIKGSKAFTVNISKAGPQTDMS